MGFLDFLGPLGSLFGGFANNIVSTANMNSQLDMQREENQRNRQFNAQQAELARQFNASEAEKARAYNTQTINEQNNYNSPTAMMSRLQEAGLNPNLVYGQLGNSSVGVGSTSAAATSPTANISGSVGTSLPSYTNAAKDMAEVALLQAQAKKTDAERELDSVELGFRAQILEGVVKLQGSQFDLQGSERKLNEKQLDSLSKQMAIMDEMLGSIRADIDLKKEQHQAIKWSNELFERTIDDVVRKIQNEAKVSDVEARYAAKTAVVTIMSLQAQAYKDRELAKQAAQYTENLKEEFKNIEKTGKEIDSRTAYNTALSVKVDAETADITFGLSQDMKYSDVERTVNLVTDCIDSASNLLNGVANYSGARSRLPSRRRQSRTSKSKRALQPADTSPVQM